MKRLPASLPTLIVLAVLMTGCATYQPPTSGPTATIQMESASASLMVGTSRCGKHRLPDRAAQPVTIPAGGRIWLQVNESGARTLCRGEYSFWPRPDAAYVVVLRTCVFSLTRIAPSLGEPDGLIEEGDTRCLRGR